MTINNQVVRGLTKARSIITCLIFFVAGGVFLGIGIYVLINPSATESGQVNHGLDFVFIGIGALVMVISVIAFIKTLSGIKRMKPLTEEEVKVNEAVLRVDAPEIENVKDVKLFFHFGGKMNQSYFVENKEGQTIYECRMTKFNLVGSDTFDFIDFENHYQKTHKIGKTMTSSTNYQTLSSHFNIDGINCWEYLHRLGYETHQEFLSGGKAINRFDLVRLGKTVASIYLANMKDPWNEASVDLFHFSQGSLRLEIIDARLEDVVFAAFVIARVNMFE